MAFTVVVVVVVVVDTVVVVVVDVLVVVVVIVVVDVVVTVEVKVLAERKVVVWVLVITATGVVGNDLDVMEVVIVDVACGVVSPYRSFTFKCLHYLVDLLNCSLLGKIEYHFFHPKLVDSRSDLTSLF